MNRQIFLQDICTKAANSSGKQKFQLAKSNSQIIFSQSASQFYMDSASFSLAGRMPASKTFSFAESKCWATARCAVLSADSVSTSLAKMTRQRF
ncbi:MAG: hypothetical protein AAGF98_13560 [Cyanobacteria bacterium P01_H01_bin.153]